MPSTSSKHCWAADRHPQLNPKVEWAICLAPCWAEETATTQQSQSGIGDLLGSLLGGGTTTAQQPQNQQASTGLDVGDLVNAGMAFMNTKSQGGNNMQAIVNALVSGSAMGNSQHRSQSGALVVNSLLQAIGGMAGNK